MVHALTASGALLAYLALRDATAGDFRRAFLWLAAATVVDAADGWFARRAHVKTRLPHFDGARLDDIVDYLTFVFVPVWVLERAGGMPEGPAGVGVAAAVLLSSAYGFSRADAKSADHFFTGFPSYWNIVVLYLVALDAGPVVSSAVLLTLSALVFVPIGYVYPSRTPTLQVTTVATGIVWGALMMWIIWTLPTPPRPVTIVSLLFPLYYTVLSFVLHTRRVR